MKLFEKKEERIFEIGKKIAILLVSIYYFDILLEKKKSEPFFIFII
jgi:hypothetical protein